MTSDYFTSAPPPAPDPEPCAFRGLEGEAGHDHGLCKSSPSWLAWRRRELLRERGERPGEDLIADGTADPLAALDRDEPVATLTLDQAARATALDEVYAIVARHGAAPHTAAELVTLADYVCAGVAGVDR